jgi:hypothetical protein
LRKERKDILKIREQFRELKSKKDLAELLSEAKNMLYGKETKPITFRNLINYTDSKFSNDRYKTFTIKKKSGSFRIINAPVSGLKSILRPLNFVFQCIYTPHQAATGFVHNKSIVFNAEKHVGNNYVLNIDLKDFFHSFDRNRVIKGLINKPFYLNRDKRFLAFLVASLCTHKIEVNGAMKIVLPQGSPTSPTLTNILCEEMDYRLSDYAENIGAIYTRYADDITFSSSKKIISTEEFYKELKLIIEEGYGLEINSRKTRLQKAGYRQEVTGLIVNEKVNVRRRYIKQMRMWIYLWEKYDYKKANIIFKRDYISDKGHVKKINTDLLDVLEGKLQYLKMVKGHKDETYLRLRRRFDKLIKEKLGSNIADVEVPPRKLNTKNYVAEVETETDICQPLILKVNYTSSLLEQTSAYPMFKFPKKGTVVRSYRKGKTKRRGYKEKDFQESIITVFGSHFIVSGELRINTGKNTRPFEPDITLIDKKNKSLIIDIEIDEPYAGITRQPTHCKGDDNMRDFYFVDRGWVVIRFSEYQVHVFEMECLSFISSVIQAVSPSHITPELLADIQPVENANSWDTIQAQKWEDAKYREEYLDHIFMPVEEKHVASERDLNEQEHIEEKLVKSTSIGTVDKTPSIGFNISNKYPRDSRIEFDPIPHNYSIDNIPVPSVTFVIDKFFPVFDTKKWARQKARELNMPVEEVEEMWKKIGEEASQKGRFLHEQIEKYFLKQDYEQTDTFHLFEQFILDHPELEPFRSEWRIFDEEFCIAGTIDLICKNDGEYQIYDWKRSKKVVDLISGIPKDKNNFQHGVGKLCSVDDTSYNKYCLQQSLYRYILEKNYNLTISKMYLVVLYPGCQKYYKVEVPYQKNSIEYILSTL